MTVLLMIEWYRVKQCAVELRGLKEDYQAYVQLLRTKLSARKSIVDDECITSCDQFVTINRDLTYLRESALAFGGSECNELMMKSLAGLYEPYEHKLDAREQPQASKELKKRTPIKKQRARQASPQAGQANPVMSWPLERGGFWVSSPFGPRKKADGTSGFHQGIDLAAVKGTSVSAAASGVVIEAGYVQGYGNTIVIMHNRKYKTRYAHLNKIYVKCGQKVERRQAIGSVGNTGRVRSAGGDGSHLHFEVYLFGKRVNPRRFLP